MCCCRHDAVDQEAIFQQEFTRLESEEGAIDPGALRSFISSVVQDVVFDNGDVVASRQSLLATFAPPGAGPTGKDHAGAILLADRVYKRVQQDHRAAASKPAHRSTSRRAGA